MQTNGMDEENSVKESPVNLQGMRDQETQRKRLQQDSRNVISRLFLSISHLCQRVMTMKQRIERHTRERSGSKTELPPKKTSSSKS